MKKAVQVLNIEVFIAVTLAIMGVFYEGMSLAWFPIVGILIVIMDYSFLLSTILNILYFRKEKIVWIFSIISMSMLIIAFAMKFAGMSYPIWSLVVWYFYIWFFYGLLILRIQWKKK